MFGFFRRKKLADLNMQGAISKLDKQSLERLIREANEKVLALYNLKLRLDLERENRERAEFEQIVKGAK